MSSFFTERKKKQIHDYQLQQFEYKNCLKLRHVLNWQTWTFTSTVSNLVEIELMLYVTLGWNWTITVLHNACRCAGHHISPMYHSVLAWATTLFIAVKPCLICSCGSWLINIPFYCVWGWVTNHHGRTMSIDCLFTWMSLWLYNNNGAYLLKSQLTIDRMGSSFGDMLYVNVF